jgi:hypothetical protein
MPIRPFLLFFLSIGLTSIVTFCHWSPVKSASAIAYQADRPMEHVVAYDSIVILADSCTEKPGHIFMVQDENGINLYVRGQGTPIRKYASIYYCQTGSDCAQRLKEWGAKSVLYIHPTRLHHSHYSGLPASELKMLHTLDNAEVLEGIEHTVIVTS